MKTITNKLIKIIKALPKIKTIIRSFYTFETKQDLLNKDDKYKQRINICMSCENVDNEGKSCVIEGSQPCCSICGCSIKIKAIYDKCPINKW